MPSEDVESQIEARASELFPYTEGVKIGTPQARTVIDNFALRRGFRAGARWALSWGAGNSDENTGKLREALIALVETLEAAGYTVGAEEEFRRDNPGVPAEPYDTLDVARIVLAETGLTAKS